MRVDLVRDGLSVWRGLPPNLKWLAELLNLITAGTQKTMKRTLAIVLASFGSVDNTKARPTQTSQTAGASSSLATSDIPMPTFS